LEDRRVRRLSHFQRPERHRTRPAFKRKPGFLFSVLVLFTSAKAPTAGKASERQTHRPTCTKKCPASDAKSPAGTRIDRSRRPSSTKCEENLALSKPDHSRSAHLVNIGTATEFRFLKSPWSPVPNETGNARIKYQRPGEDLLKV